MNIKQEWFQAVENRDQKALLELLDRGADINFKHDRFIEPRGTISPDATALMHAIGVREYELIRWLLVRGASLVTEDCYGFSATTHALISSRSWNNGWVVPNPDPEPLRILLAAGAEYGIFDAVFMNDVDLLRTLIDEGADVNKGQGSYHGSILQMAAGAGQQEVVDLLLARGADPNADDDIEGRPLFGATVMNHIAIVVALLDHGADINAVDGGSRSALAIAMNAGHRELVALLESRGATRSLKDAVRSGDRAYLLEALRADPMADWHAPERVGLLRHAVQMPILDSVRLLLDLGADIRATLDDERPFLTSAVISRNAQIVQLLINRGADVHAVDEDGRTAIMEAIDQESEEIIAILVLAGAKL